MTGKEISDSFTEEERATLHRLADMFGTKEERKLLRDMMDDGVTISQMVMAYRTQKFAMGKIKAFAGLIVLLGAAVGYLKGFGVWGGN